MMTYNLTDIEFGTVTTHESFGSAQNVGQLCSAISGRYRVTDESGRVLGTWTEGTWTPLDYVQCEAHEPSTESQYKTVQCPERAEYLGKMMSLNARTVHLAINVCEAHSKRFSPGIHEDRGVRFRDTLTKLKTD